MANKPKTLIKVITFKSNDIYKNKFTQVYLNEYTLTEFFFTSFLGKCDFLIYVFAAEKGMPWVISTENLNLWIVVVMQCNKKGKEWRGEKARKNMSVNTYSLSTFVFTKCWSKLLI
jgi:hypothetical protein